MDDVARHEVAGQLSVCAHSPSRGPAFPPSTIPYSLIARHTSRRRRPPAGVADRSGPACEARTRTRDCRSSGVTRTRRPRPCQADSERASHMPGWPCGSGPARRCADGPTLRLRVRAKLKCTRLDCSVFSLFLVALNFPSYIRGASGAPSTCCFLVNGIDVYFGFVSVIHLRRS
jgi:hypothetical protein